MSWHAAASVRRPVVPTLLVVVAIALGALGWSAASSTSSPVDGHHAVGAADGVLPDDATVFTDRPAITRLDPGLRAALRRATSAAADDGVTVRVNSGWRSAAYQEQLLDDAIAKYGSASAAARWVDTPGTSAHVSGDAVDVGHADAAAWLGRYGAAYGLCRVYRNEPWHFELRPGAAEHGCPRMYADPTDARAGHR